MLEATDCIAPPPPLERENCAMLEILKPWVRGSKVTNMYVIFSALALNDAIVLLTHQAASVVNHGHRSTETTACSGGKGN